jgi:hypothetical protein
MTPPLPLPPSPFIKLASATLSNIIIVVIINIIVSTVVATTLNVFIVNIKPASATLSNIIIFVIINIIVSTVDSTRHDQHHCCCYQHPKPQNRFEAFLPWQCR